MEIIFEFVFIIFNYLVGALVGVMWPPRSVLWARWQKLGFLLGLAALLGFGIAFIGSYLRARNEMIRPAIVVGLFALLGYAVVGNTCRKYHEGK